MREHRCKNIIFISGTNVYGDSAEIQITENCPKDVCVNSYGRIKSLFEQVLIDVQKADAKWNVILLPYLNPVGAHHSGSISDTLNGIPNSLMPYITQVAVGKRSELDVFDNDCLTYDGTG